ncbi:mCG63065 [Mus musculus]|nr:mCG63065 [Mus musculus]
MKTIRNPVVPMASQRTSPACGSPSGLCGIWSSTRTTLELTLPYSNN